MKEYKKIKHGITKTIKLNNRYMKIEFTHSKQFKMWFMTIVVSKSKRQCNDCLNKTESSPKLIYGQRTQNNLGIQPLVIALKELIQFEKTVEPGQQIRIIGASDRLKKIYTRLFKYGYYAKMITYSNGTIHPVICKDIK